MYRSSDIASAVLAVAEENNEDMTVIRLQRLVYLCYAWALAGIEAKFTLEPVEARWWGPVFKNLYDVIRKSQKGEQQEKVGSVDGISKVHRDFIRLVYGSFKGYSNKSLGEYVYDENGPWNRAFKNKEKVILDKHIVEHFKDKIIIHGGI